MNNIILFDGDCNFCDKSVQFIIKNDIKSVFKFTSLQSDIGQELITKYNIPKDTDSVVLIQDDTYYIKSSAALRICKELKSFWKIFYIFLIVPKPIRDIFYNILAKNRYKLFGKRDSCMIPTKEQRERFL